MTVGCLILIMKVPPNVPPQAEAEAKEETIFIIYMYIRGIHATPAVNHAADCVL